MRIAITGTRGFIGSHIKNHLLSLGYIVEEIPGDLRSAPLPIVDCIIHMAAKMGGVGYFSVQQFDPIINNTLIDARIISHCLQHNIRLFYPSSACAYPVELMERGEPLRESMLEILSEPDQTYGLEKLYFTRLSLHSSFDFRVGILHTIYGEGQSFIGDGAKFPPQICYKFLQKSEIEVWGSGEQTRTFLHIDDAVKMITEVALGDVYYGPVNISHPDEIKVTDVVKHLQKVTGRDDIRYSSNKPTGPSRRPVDMTKYFNHYKHRPLINYKEGFGRLFDYIRKSLAETGE